MHGKSQADREEAMNKIMEDLIEEVVETKNPEGKYWRTTYVIFYSEINSVITYSHLFLF